MNFLHEASASAKLLGAVAPWTCLIMAILCTVAGSPWLTVAWLSAMTAIHRTTPRGARPS